MITAEELIIATILNDSNSHDDIFSLLSVTHFAEKQNMEIYSAMQDMHKHGRTVDLVTLSEKINKQQLHYLLDLTAKVGYVPNILQHVSILLDRSTRERIKYMANTLLLEASDNNNQVDDILIMASRLLNEIDSTDQPTLTALPTEVPVTLKKISEAKEHRDKTGYSYTGVNTGFEGLNRSVTGWQPETLTIIAARPGMGKTSVMLYSAEAAAQTGMVLIFSLEMSKNQLIKRAISGKSGIEYHRLTNGNISDDDLRKVLQGSEKLMESKIYIDDTSGIHVDTLIRTCRKIAKKHKITAVFIDYLQLMRGEGGNRTQEIGYISRNLKGLSKQIYAPVICLAQLNRANESRSDKRPTLADLRDSGEIEQDADDIIMLYREEYYTAVPEEDIGKMELIRRKCRNGSIGTDIVRADLAYNNFYELDNDGKPQVNQKRTFDEDPFPKSTIFENTTTVNADDLPF